MNDVIRTSKTVTVSMPGHRAHGKIVRVLRLEKEAEYCVEWNHESAGTWQCVLPASALGLTANTPETPEQLPESLSDPAIVMERVRALHQRTDAALWLLRYLNRLGGLGQDKHRLIDAVLEGRAKVLGDTLHIEQPSEKASE